MNYHSYNPSTMTGVNPAGFSEGCPAHPSIRAGFHDQLGYHLDSPSVLAAGSTYRGLDDCSRFSWSADARPVPSYCPRSTP